MALVWSEVSGVLGATFLQLQDWRSISQQRLISLWFAHGWGSFVGADHRGSIDIIKAELALFKQKMLIVGKLCMSVLMTAEPFV